MEKCTMFMGWKNQYSENEYTPNPGIEPASPAAPALMNRFFITEPPGKPVPGRENPKPLIAGG